MIAATLVAALSVGAVAESLNTTHAPTTSAIERGRYLVGPAGQCSDCHGANLQGGPIGLLAPTLPPIVQRNAPKIAGLPMFHDEPTAVHFLETGELPGNRHARPPMPHYRFNHDDAVAIVAYLKSLAERP
jgi:mono/diheme cytochrome c family protein